MDFVTSDWMYSLAGVAVGLLVGLTGVGGGSLMTPVLVLLFGFHPASAVGTDLLYASATKSVGTAVHGRNGTVDWAIVGRLAFGSLPGAAVTLLLLSQAGGQAESTQHVITIILAVVLLLTAVSILSRARLVGFLSRHMGACSPAQTSILTIFLGAVLGVLVSMTSIGAGSIGMTALLVLYPDHPANRLVGSDIAHAVPLTLVAGAGHLALGTVNLAVLAFLLIGSVPGIIFGSMLAKRASDRLLRPILAITLAIVGLKLLF